MRSQLFEAVSDRLATKLGGRWDWWESGIGGKVGLVGSGIGGKYKL